MRTGEEPGADINQHVDAIERGADTSLLPRMFGLLEDDDPYGLLWSVFYVMEGMDDAYLEQLVTVLPALDERAPGWAETAVLRIINTRGETEDCTESFEAFVRATDDDTRGVIKGVLVRLLDSDDVGLSRPQRDSLQDTIAAVEVV